MFKENFISKINKPETNDSESKLLDSVEEQELNKEFSHIEVKEYANNYFKETLGALHLNKASKVENIDIPYYDQLRHLSIMSGSEDSFIKEGIITDDFSDCNFIFLQELINFIEKNESDEKMDVFLSFIYKKYFHGVSRPAGITSSLRLDQAFDFAAKVTRIKKMQSLFGTAIVGDLALAIDSFYDPDSREDELLESFKKSSISEKLDKINLLKSVYAELIGYSQSGYTSDGHGGKLISFIEKIKNSNDNVFIGYSLDALLDYVDEEYENPSRGLYYDPSDPGNSRVWEELSVEEESESKLLDDTIIPARPLGIGEKIIQIASNAVAIADHSNLPIEYSTINLRKYNLNILDNSLSAIRDACELSETEKDRIIFEEFIEFCNNEIFFKREGLGSHNTEELASIWSNFSSLSKSDWKEYFDLRFGKIKCDEKLDEYTNKKWPEYQQKNLDASIKVFENFKANYPKVLSQIKNPSIEKEYNNFVKAYDSGDYRNVLNYFESLEKGLRDLRGIPDNALNKNENDNRVSEIEHDLMLEADELRLLYERNNNEFESNAYNYIQKLFPNLQEDDQRFDNLIRKIIKDRDDILKNLKGRIDSIIEEKITNRILVYFNSFNDFEDELGLLLQHLYSPLIRRRIEDDFGIKLNELPLHYHINFLRFLSERDEQEVEKIKEFLNQGNNKENKINKVKSFLSLEFDNSMGVKIVEIGEHFNKEPGVTDMLFSKYVEFVEHLNKNIQNLEDLYKDIFYDKNIDKDKLVKLMMLRANQLLLSAHDKIKSNNSSATELEIKSLLEELDREIANKFKNIEELKDIANDLNHAISLINEEDKNTGSSNQINRIKKALEKKVDQLVYGYDLAQLPKDFTNFENSQVSPEKIPEQAPLYFPVGISKDLPAWESVLKGDMKFAKPIDLYGYLFWLNNQNRKIDLIVCDEIQVNNYQLRFGKTKEESQVLSVKIGEEESKNYQKIIDSFKLSNINIVKYNDFLDSNKENYDHYTQVVEKLKNHPVFEKMFLSMVQESVSGADKAEYLSYANEELAWILSTDGTKVGHLNEARYDILSAVIKNLELFGDKLNIDTINSLDDENVLTILQAIFINLRDIINEKKSKLEKKSSPFLYFQRLQEHLNKINIDKKIKPDKRIRKSDVVLNFSCPDVGSASFGWRGDIEKNESAVKFKEPYSTYFYKSKGDLLTNSDQVVALEDGYISGKILTLEHSKQIEYANNVLKPMLGHYLKTLDNAPLDYFKKVSKDKGELIKELNNSQSLLDLLKYIQKYIVQPASQ